MTTREVCAKAGLTYDGMWIGLPEEYYKENYPEEYRRGKLKSAIYRENNKEACTMNTKVSEGTYKEAMTRLRRLEL